MEANRFEPYLSKEKRTVAMGGDWKNLNESLQKVIKVPKRELMRTKNNEALVECYLTKWKVDEKGSLMRLTQSKSFKL